MEDALLVQECLKGKPRAQKALFDKFAPKMLAVCARYMKDQAETEDVFQIGMVKVFNKLSDFKAEGPLEGWIRRIMVNSCLDQLRKNQRFVTDKNIDDVSYRIEVKEEISSQLMAEDLIALIRVVLFAVGFLAFNNCGGVLLGLSCEINRSFLDV